MNLIVPLVAVLASLPTSASHVAQPLGAWTIKPGVSVGQVHLGEHIEAVRSLLGKEALKSPHADAAMGHFWEVWSGKRGSELDVYSVRGPSDSAATPDVRVRQIRTTSPSFRTASGIHVGSSESQIKRAIPGLTLIKNTAKFHLLDSRKQGIAIEMKGGRCSAIVVHPKGRSVTADYLPFPGYML